MLFSILTITYNRQHTIHRLWKSLQRMRDQEFEWVVIDNGSSDGTDSLISTWQCRATFNIVYHRLPANGGIAKGLNVGKKLISGKYVVVIDDDDALFDNALAEIKFYIAATEFDYRPDVGSLLFRAVTEDGILHGELSRLGPVFESTSLQMKYVHTKHRVGERCAVTKADVFIEFDHIELPPPNNSLLEVVSLRKARKYKTIYIEHPVRIYWQSDGFDRMTTRPRHYVATSLGNYYENFYRLEEQIDYFLHAPRYFTKSARNMCRSGLHNNRFYRQQFHEFSNRYAILLWMIFGLLPGTVKFCLDLLRRRLKIVSISENVHFRGGR